MTRKNSAEQSRVKPHLRFELQRMRDKFSCKLLYLLVLVELPEPPDRSDHVVSGPRLTRDPREIAARADKSQSLHLVDPGGPPCGLHCAAVLP